MEIEVHEVQFAQTDVNKYGNKIHPSKPDWQVTNDNDQKDVKISKDRDLFTYNLLTITIIRSY